MKALFTIAAVLSLTSGTMAMPAHAEPQVFAGTLTVSAEFEAERGTIQVEGPAAYALFGLAAFRTRIEYVADNLRRVRGHGMACYEHGDAQTPVDHWTYTCELRVGELGEITAPPL